jgi:hypothetical protein
MSDPQVSGQATEESLFNSMHVQEMFLSFRTSKPTPVSIHFPTQCISVVPSPEVKRPACKTDRSSV